MEVGTIALYHQSTLEGRSDVRSAIEPRRARHSNSKRCPLDLQGELEFRGFLDPKSLKLSSPSRVTGDKSHYPCTSPPARFGRHALHG
ncbi:hypothetical protein J6590_020710 [Homalodisca vitripennis]|nr:hypothetical protein J6590_020710 [Homalodisca vitripennis]